MSAAGKLKLELQLVARLNTQEDASSYYPPRARWYSRFFVPWFAVQRALHLGRIRLPSGLSTVQFFLSLILPGYAFFANDRRVLGWAFVAVYLYATLLFIAALGYLIGNVGYGLIIAAHASSIIFLEGHWLRERCQFGSRLALAVVTLLVVWLAIYAPLVGFAERHWIVPLRVRDKVVIVQRRVLMQAIKRGDFVVYSMREGGAGDAHRGGGAVRVQAGFGWGPVLAVARDRVEFSTNSFAVNGVARPLRPHMPMSGDLVVPEKHWFVWPELDINQNGNTSEATISAMMLQMAVVPEAQFVGKPFKRWFGRRQVLS